MTSFHVSFSRDINEVSVVESDTTRESLEIGRLATLRRETLPELFIGRLSNEVKTAGHMYWGNGSVDGRRFSRACRSDKE